MSGVPITEMFVNTGVHLDRAYHHLGESADWMRSDWTPAGAELTDEQARARTEIFRAITQAKVAINNAKSAIDRAVQS